MRAIYLSYESQIFDFRRFYVSSLFQLLLEVDKENRETELPPTATIARIPIVIDPEKIQHQASTHRIRVEQQVGRDDVSPKVTECANEDPYRGGHSLQSSLQRYIQRREFHAENFHVIRHASLIRDPAKWSNNSAGMR